MWFAWLLLLYGSINFVEPRHRPRPPRDQVSNCAPSCSGLSNELHYEPHKEYVYDVSSTATLKISQGNYQNVVTQRSRAHIIKHSQCEFSLKLTGATLTGMEVPQDWARVLETHPLRFGFDDGQVTAVCPGAGDPVWAINLKRSVLSLFQTMHESDWETDVIGECPVERENHKRGSVLNVKSSKNATSCYRGAHVSGIRAIPYRFHSESQAPPMVEASQKCDRELRDGVLKKATCTEAYRVPSPFTSGDLMSTHVDAAINHLSTTPSNAPLAAFVRRETIRYDYSADTSPSSKANPHEAKANVDALCHQSSKVNSEAASNFVDLVSNLRTLAQAQIQPLVRRDCGAFLDALAMCASPDCIAVLASLINQGVSNPNVFASLALVDRPDQKVVDHVASFIARVPNEGLLGVSSLVQSYCLAHPDCGHEAGVKRIVEALVAKIRPRCMVGDRFAEVEAAVYVLKAIGNIGDELISMPMLVECVGNGKNTLEVQLTAIDALRKKPCTEQRNHKITQLYFNEKEDEEIRIAAFRQLMKCPSEKLVDEVVDHLHNETSNQVGSYVWSYLNAKRRSTKPATCELQRLLKKEHIPQRFDLDPRRFSRFYEFGYFEPQNNYGGHVDSSIIFSPKGYIPREMIFNFTVHLFGKSLNILELGARAEGLEQLDNELFGADGYISNPNGHVFREKKFRSHYDKVNQMKVLYMKKGDFIEGQLSASMYLRMFGDDLKYWAFEEDNFFERMKEYMALDKVLPKLAKEFSYKKSRNLMLAQLRPTIPTICGLPLQLSLDAALVSNVEYKAKLNLVDLLHQRPDADALLDAKPSASVYASQSLVFVAAGVRSGMRCASTLYSATSISGEMQLKNGKTFTVKVVLPDDDATLAQYERKLMRIDNDRLSPIQSSTAPREHHYCTSSTTGKVTGLKFCAEVQNRYPAIKADVRVEKVDPLLKSYQFVVERESTPGHQKLSIRADTPGSKVNRKMETTFELSIPQKHLKMNLITPFKKIILDGELKERKRLEDYEAKLNLNVDDRHRYNLDGAFKATMENRRRKYTLMAKTAAGSAQTADLKSEIQYSGRPSPYVSFDFQLDKVFDKAVVFKTLFNLAGSRYESKLQYSGPKFNGKLEAEATHQALLDVKGSIKGEYQIGNERKHLLSIGGEQTFTKHGKNHNLKHSVQFESSSLGKLDYQVYSKHEGNKMQNALEVNRDGRKSAIHVDINRNPNDLYTAVATAKSDRLGLNHKANIAYKNKFPLQFELKIDAESPTMKGLHAGVEYAMKTDPKWKFDGKARLAYPGKEFIINEHIDETQREKYKMTTMVQWARNGKLDATSDITVRKGHEYSLDSVIRVAGVAEPFYVKEHATTRGDNHNIFWQIRHGSAIVYEMKGDFRGLGTTKKLDLEVKSEKLNPKFHYHMTGNMDRRPDTTTLNAVLKGDGREMGKADLSFPSAMTRPTPHRYHGDFSWNYKNKPHKLMGEYTRNKDQRGSTHMLKVDSNNDIKAMLQFDLLDKLHLKCDVEKGGRKVSSTDIRSTPLRWDNFELEGTIDTDRPLPKRSMKTKAVLMYRPDQVSAEGRLESDGERYAAEGKWRKQREGADRRHYTYSLGVHSPQGALTGSQQLLVEGGFTIRKAQTELGLTAGRREYKLTCDVDSGPEHFKSTHELKSNAGTHLKHMMDYKHIGGRRTLKKLLKLNEKEIDADMETVYQDREMKVNLAIKSTLPRFESLVTNLGCEKATYWNCKVEGNVNNNYIVKGHETLSPQHSDLGYVLRLDRFVDSEGKLEYSIDKRASKYTTIALLRNFAKKYDFNMNIDRDRGSLKLQTPTQLVTDAQMHVIRKGPEEFEIMSRSGGASRGKIVAHLKTADNDQLFKIQITDIKEPFELLLKNTFARGRQSSQAELILDPLTTKQTYGVENIIESDGGKFRALKTTLKHPKRSVHVEVLRPAQNKYSISVQPHVGSRRHPTVAEMTYDKKPNSYHWEASLSDDALKSPLKGKIDVVKSGHDELNYGLNIKSEFDYSGQPEKFITHSLRIERKAIGAARHRRRRDAPASGAKFEAELLATHPASNTHTRVWANIDRKDVHGALLPVHANMGVEMKNTHKQLVQYALNMDSDAATYTELKAMAPGTNMRVRIDAVTNKHYKLAFYRNSEKASMIGEVKMHDKGVELDLRDEKSGDVKLHASAEMPNEFTAEFELWHSQRGKRIRDARLALELENDNLLKAKAYVRPEIENDITVKANEAIAEAKNFEHNALLKDTLVPMIQSHKTVAKDVFDTLNHLVKTWLNEQRDFASELGPEYRNMVNQVEEQYELFQEAVLTSYDTAQQAVEQAIAAMPRSQFVEQLRQLRDGGGDLPKQLAEVLKPLTDLFKAYSAEVDKLQKTLAEALDYVEKNLKVKEMMDALRDYRRQFQQVDVIREVLAKARQLSREYQMPEVERKLHEVELNRQQYESNIIKLYNNIKDLFLDRIVVRSLSGVVEAIIDKISGEELDDTELEKRLHDVIQFLRGRISGETFAHNLWRKYIPTVKRIGPGEYVAEVTVLHGASSLREVIEDLHPERFLAVKSALMERARSLGKHPEGEHFGAGSIYTFKTVPDQQWLPPFDSYAYIIAPDRFITFDGRVFAFHAPCDYLLATDLLHQQFALVANFVPQRGGAEFESIKAEVRGDQITMHMNGKVEVGGSPVSMPWQKVDTMDGESLVSVHREGDWTILQTYIGVEVKCNSKRQVCEVKLPGRLHAQSSGLLGCNDNEPANDLDLIDGTNNNETNILAEHWSVRGTCRANEAHPLRSRESEKCEEMFISSGSPLSDCFSQIHPTPFELMCSNAKPNQQCGAASAFVVACDNHGIDVSLPKPCVDCEHGTELDEKKRIENPHAGHDVVFVVEERSCLDPYRANIARMAQTIAQRQRDARFGWIGFGGEGVRHAPYIHYDNDAALLDANAVVRQTQHKFETESGFEPKPMCPMQAIKFATERFPFRLASAKSIVLIACKPCVGSHRITQSELLDSLLNQGITMHMLTLAKIKTKQTGVNAVGMNAEYLFNNAGAHVGDRSTVVQPNDVCSVVAQESHGSVFNIKHGFNVAATMVQPKDGDHCALCECEVHKLCVHNVCEPCDPIKPASLESSKFSGKASHDDGEITLDEFFLV